MQTGLHKSLNLPWHQNDCYIIHLYARGGSFPTHVMESLKETGLHFVSAGALSIQTDRNWPAAWEKIYQVLTKMNATHLAEVSLVAGDHTSHQAGRSDHKTVEDAQAIAEGMWLGDALLEDRILCYLQPVVYSKNKVFGYESFARVKSADGEIIAGDAIIAASKALGIEFMIDRMLQVQAIQTYVSSDFDGFLFVNFLPGFIHRPAIYLEDLGNTVKEHGVIPKHVVLEFTKSETPRDLRHLRSVCEYGRTRGYSIALDDINTVENARKLVTEIRPDFVKIDMALAQRASEEGAANIISKIVQLVHENGGTVIGEGVEDAENFEQLKKLGVDLFQGYHFSAPVPVDRAIKRKRNVG